MPAPLGPVALGLTLFRLWRRLPPAQRRLLFRLARTHGPRVAAGAAAAVTARTRKRRRP